MDSMWCYSLNGDEYDGAYDSREDAIEEGNQRAWEMEHEVFYVGTAVKTFVPGVDVDLILDNIRDNAQSEGGEFAEDYLMNTTNDQEQELEEKLNEVLHQWLEKYKHEVNFYSVQNEEEIKTVEPTETN